MVTFTRRHLPHFHAPERALFVTFRLHGSLPNGRHFDSSSVTSGQAFAYLDRLLDDATSGPLYLRMPEIARIVATAIQRCEGYSSHAWVIMPNHVHLLITPHGDTSELMRRLKGVTAREANLQLCRSGPFWQHESYDRLVRDAKEFSRIENYIIQNPVRAGLATSPEEYRWSSAWKAQATASKLEAGLKPGAS